MSSSKGYRIIDCRNRPPVPQFAGLFQVKKFFFVEKRSNVGNRAARAWTSSMELEGIGTPRSMDLWYKEAEEMGIEHVLVNGRCMTGAPNGTMNNEDLAALVASRPDFMSGLAMVNLDQAAKKTADEVYKAIKEYGFPGANIEPGYTVDGGAFGYRDGARGLAIDDFKLRPIAEAIQAAGGFVHIQGGMICGPDISYNNPAALDRFLQLFPNLTVVLNHGGYPYVSEILGLLAKHPNFYLIPDLYMFQPGGQLYQMNLNELPDQMLFGSCYPFGTMKESVEDTLALLDSPLCRVRPDVMENYLYNNAKRLLHREG